MLDDARVFRFQNGQHLVPNPNPLEGSLMVRWVPAEGQRVGHAIGEHLVSTAVDERTDDAVRPPGRDAAEPPKPGAAQDARKHGFGLVVLGMTDRNAVQALGGGDLEQRPVPKLAGCRLDR